MSHSLAGATVHAGLDRDGGLRPAGRLLLALLLANAPDLDLIPGILTGDPNRFHHGGSHSLVTAIVVGAAAALMVRLGVPGWPVNRQLRLGAPLGTGIVVSGLWASHVVLDLFTADFTLPYGVPLFWPISDRYFLLGPWFPHVVKSVGRAGPLEFAWSLVAVHNLWTVAVEIGTLVPLLAAVVWWRRRRTGTKRSETDRGARGGS